MTREQSLRKKYEAADRKMARLIEKYIVKYGYNWTIDSLSAKEKIAFWSVLRQQKKAIDALVKLDIKSGRLKRRTV